MSVIVIVIAVISAVVITALLCMKVKTNRAGDNGREIPAEDSVYFGDAYACI